MLMQINCIFKGGGSGLSSRCCALRPISDHRQMIVPVINGGLRRRWPLHHAVRKVVPPKTAQPVLQQESVVK